ncbi:phenylpropionate dioxygenase-like ring-hydroxylating dioxygenase large terminal subunit [Variovorax paradoxus]|uniref:Rieske (2Fe-2S) protein n=1 Tax=Variovorax paradoxus TaxID=34073 RepID=UPI00278598A8|nr:Rieske (2Fe-2S) protein [Variovorax paradoxus]MDQ0027555.1 phenylpropionate dioxygenase-like ring-hydroxylating dioxygenase large terminal subunit [Variovorax paradoxus]
MSADSSISTWHPVAPSAELRAGANIVAGFAEGRELALWRSADGTAQAWENRCPHRSVRFTLGQVVENRLVCAYHGWQYAAGNGQCTHIPAHPDMPPPRNVCAKMFSAVEAAGMVWVYLAAAEPPPPPRDDAVPQDWSFCRTLTVRANAADVRDALAARDFTANTPSPALLGALDRIDTAALVLDARPRLAFIHLWTPAARGTDKMKALHTAARGLRGEIEARQSTV